MEELVDINTNDNDRTKYCIEFFRVNTMIETEEFFKSSNVTDIGSIPISSKDYINE